MRNDILERKDEILEWIEQRKSKAFMCKQLQCKQDTLNSYLDKMGIDYVGNQGGFGIKKEYPNYKTVTEYINSTCVQPRVLKRKLIKEGLKENKCENCGRLFIPVTSSNNPNQKARNDQKYCDNLYLDTGKTCKEIGALNKQKEKVQNSPILIEYNREYKRMHGLHYNHQKKFTEKKFKEWSKKARKLRDDFTDNKLEDFKMELKKLSDLYWK